MTITTPAAALDFVSQNVTAALWGLGTAVPTVSVPQEVAAELAIARCPGPAEQHQWVRRIFAHSGVQQRGSIIASQAGVPGGDWRRAIEMFYPPAATPADLGPTTARRMAFYTEHGPPLALTAARAALQDAGLAAGDITHLISVSCTGFVAPGLDVRLIKGLGLAANVARTHIGFMGCHAAFNALAAARAIVVGDPTARVLVCSLELCSLHFAYGWHPQRVVANALFADGAAAAVVGPAHPMPSTSIPEPALPPARARWSLVETASLLLPDSEDAMTWRIGDHGYEMGLSPAVPELIATHVGAWVRTQLARHDLSVADIAHWAIHPGGPKVLGAVTAGLGLPPSACAVSRQVLARHGNMSSATVLFLLQTLAQQAATGPLVALGFGPGLMAEFMLLH